MSSIPVSWYTYTYITVMQYMSYGFQASRNVSIYFLSIMCIEEWKKKEEIYDLWGSFFIFIQLQFYFAGLKITVAWVEISQLAIFFIFYVIFPCKITFLSLLFILAKIEPANFKNEYFLAFRLVTINLCNKLHLLKLKAIILGKIVILNVLFI